MREAGNSHHHFKWLMLIPALVFLGSISAFVFGTIVNNSLTPYVQAVGPQYGMWTVRNYVKLATDSYYWVILLRTFRISILTVVFCAAFGFPVAVYVSARRGRYRAFLTALIVAPLFINVLVRVFGWYLVLGREGIVARALSLVLGSSPNLLYTEGAVVVGLTQNFLPMMIIMIISSIEQIDQRILKAAEDLGAGSTRVFWRIVFPLALPGAVAASILIFTLSIGQFAVPILLGGQRNPVLGYTAYEYQILEFNWPLGSAVVAVMVLTIMLVLAVYGRLVQRNRSYRRLLAS